MRCVLPALLAVVLVACAHGQDKDPAAMNKVPMHSVCVGRMLVNLPRGGNVDWQQQFAFAQVSRLPYSIDTVEKFWGYVDKRKIELEHPTAARPKGTLGLYQKVGNNAVIMQFRDPGVADLEGYYTERYLWLGQWGYEYQTGGLYDNEAAKLLPAITGTFKQVRPLNNLNPPATSGFCIDSALVTGRIGPIWSAVSVKIPGWKRVSVSAGASEDDGSRARMPWETGHAPPVPTAFDDLEMLRSSAQESERSGQEDRVVSFTVLRRREKPLAGLPGQEIALKMKLADGQEYYRFEWDSTGNGDRPDKSGFNFSLFAGDMDYTPDYVPPPPQDELLELWDAMLDSLKRRGGSG